MAVQYVGIGEVAVWLGRSAAAVVAYRNNFAHTPEPDAYLNGVAGWLPERKADWQAWFRTYGPGSAHRRDRKAGP